MQFNVKSILNNIKAIQYFDKIKYTLFHQIGKRHDMDESPPLSFMMDLSTPNFWRRIIDPLPFVDLEDYDELDMKVEFEQELSTRESYSSNNPLKHSPQRKRQIGPQCISFESVEVSTSANNSVKGNICAAQHTQ